MAWPSARAKTATAGGSWVPADMNAVQDQYIRADGIQADDLQASGVAQKLGLSQTGTTRRGKAIIPTTETRTNVNYGLMTTPDRVSGIVLPTDGLIAVVYHATWQESILNAARAAIFIGANQLVGPTNVVNTAGGTFALEAMHAASTTNEDHPLVTVQQGLGSIETGAYSGDATTGQIIGVVGNRVEERVGGSGNELLDGGGGPCYIFAAAGTYDISVQFKSSSGSVTVKNRKLWVWTMDF